MQLQAAQDAHGRGLPDEMAVHLGHASAMARYGLQEARRSVRALRPKALETGDLYSAMTEMFSAMTSIDATVALFGGLTSLSSQRQAELLHIAQEALTNVVRHADATRLEATIRCVTGDVDLTLRDDGCGFDTAADSDGFGLTGMAERTEAMGGRLTIESAKGAGTLVHIPVQVASIISMERRELVSNVAAVARAARLYGLPVVLSSVNVKTGLNKPTIHQLVEILPDVVPIDSTSINTWEDVDFVAAVKATGRRKLVMVALWTEVCLVFPALDALREGYDVYPVVDAVGGCAVCGLRSAASLRLPSSATAGKQRSGLSAMAGYTSQACRKT